MKIKFKHPYDINFSKNSWHSVSGQGKIYTNTPTQRLMDGISMLTLGECNRQRIRFKPKKTWVRIMVYRPDMLADPINFLDVICDGIKVGLGIDDNLFAATVDWELEPANPGIAIEVEQSDD